MATERRRYLAYMLRLWQICDRGKLSWHASLESPHTGERRGFADLSALFAFLEQQMRSHDPQEQPQDTPAVEPGNRRCTN